MRVILLNIIFYTMYTGGTRLRKPKGSVMKPPPTCWSEVSSPRKQVRISVAMAEEIAATHEGTTANVMATATEVELPGQTRQTSSSLVVEHDQPGGQISNVSIKYGNSKVELISDGVISGLQLEVSGDFEITNINLRYIYVWRKK